MAKQISAAILVLVLGSILTFVPNTTASGVPASPAPLDFFNGAEAQQFLKTLQKIDPQLAGLVNQLVATLTANPNGTNTTAPALDIADLLKVTETALKNPLIATLFNTIGLPQIPTMAKVLLEEIGRANASIYAEENSTTAGNPPSAAELLTQLDKLTLLVRLLRSSSIRWLHQNSPKDRVSDQCYDDAMDTLDALVVPKKWAIDMFDATGKVAAGVQRGYFFFTGSYDQCQDIRATIAPGDVIGGKPRKTERSFNAKYCRMDIGVSESLINSLNVDTRGVKLKLDWGLCVPETCSGSDVQGLFNIGYLNGTQLPINYVYCHEDADLSSDGGAIAVIIILAVFGFLIVIGTLYDVFNQPKVVSTSHSKPNETPNGRVPDSSANTGDAALSTVTVMEDGTGSMARSGQNGDLSDHKETSPPGYMRHKEDLAALGLTPEVINAKVKVNFDDGKDSIPPTVVNNLPVVTNVSVRQVSQPAPRAPESALEKIVCSFSLYSNIPKILHAKTAAGSISCIHGIRFLSLTWVVLGHTYNYGIISTSETFNAANLLDFEKILQRFTYQGVIGGGFAVDTFFVLSAFLLTWLKLNERKKAKRFTVGDGVMYYFHRIWRLTPVYMIVLMTFTCLYPYLGDGPMWPDKLETADNCKKYWWTNLLYVNNLVHANSECMGWTWYLANDMQFYVISPLFLIFMYMMPMVGACLTVLLLALGMGMSFWQEFIYNGNFFTMKSDDGDYWRYVYVAPWARVGCWAIGMLLGLIVHKRKKGPLRSKVMTRLGWLLATGAALFLVYIPYTENKKDGATWTKVERSFYESFGRPVWGVCVAWVIFACYNSMGGLVNRLLSWNGFIPLSRLTYAGYLVHPICMMIYVYSRRTLLYIDDYGIVYLFLGHLVVSYMVAFVVSVSFEAPFMALEKVLFRTGKK